METGENQIGDIKPPDAESSGLPAGITPKAGTGKRGRPPGTKNKPASIETGARVESRAGGSEAGNSLETAKFVGAGAVALLELVETFVHANGAKKIERRMPSKLEEFKKMAQELGLQEQEKVLLASCAEKIASRYDLLTKYGIEAVALITLAQYSVRQMSLMRFVENITKVKPVNPAPIVEAKEVQQATSA